MHLPPLLPLRVCLRCVLLSAAVRMRSSVRLSLCLAGFVLVSLLPQAAQGGGKYLHEPAFHSQAFRGNEAKRGFTTQLDRGGLHGCSWGVLRAAARQPSALCCGVNLRLAPWWKRRRHVVLNPLNRAHTLGSSPCCSFDVQLRCYVNLLQSVLSQREKSKS